jgi:GntR family transcriptional regulator
MTCANVLAVNHERYAGVNQTKAGQRSRVAEGDMPLYAHVRETLRDRILNGTYQPEARLPSESQLMRTFEASRITVRQALRDLSSEGLIFSSQGKGSFVSRPKAIQNVRRLEGFGEAMSAQGYETTARVLALEIIAAEKRVRDELGLPASGKARVIRLKRVRYLNRVPVSVEISHFPLDVGEPLMNLNLSGDVFPLLENVVGIPLGTARIQINAGLPIEEHQSLLGVDRHHPILQVERLTRSSVGRPVDYEFLYFNGETFEYCFEVERSR